MIDTTIVIPCYNEQARFPGESFAHFIGSRPDVRFLFVDDGSSDGTLGELETLHRSFPQSVRVLSLPKNAGKAEAVRRGVIKAIESGTQYVGFWDCDLATPLDMIPRFRAVFAERHELEMVFGSRVELLGHRIKRHWARYYLGRAFNTVVALLLGLRVHDTQCGAKMFRVNDDLKAIFAHRFKTNWVFDVELLARLIYLRRPRDVAQPEQVILELPLPVWHDVAGSKVRPVDFVSAARDLMKIYLLYVRPTRQRVRAAHISTRPTMPGHGSHKHQILVRGTPAIQSDQSNKPAQRRAA